MQACETLRGTGRRGGCSLLFFLFLLVVPSSASFRSSPLRNALSDNLLGISPDLEPVVYNDLDTTTSTTTTTTDTSPPLEPPPVSPSVPHVVMMTGGSQSYRLPDSLKPLHYTIRIQPLIHGDQSMNGTVEIDLEVLQPIRNITVHAALMAIMVENVKLEGGIGNSPTEVPNITHFSADNERNFFTAHLSGKIGVGRAVRYTIPFVASLKNWGEGFFTFTYNDSNVERPMLASLNHPAFARQAFPCLDEPHLKATFSLKVARQNNVTAISNMPVDDTLPLENQPGWVVDRFQKTPLMAPYQLLLVVTPFNHVEVPSKTGLPIRVWGRSETLSKTPDLIDVTVELLDYFENYTAVPFPLPKLDVIAVPAGAPGAYGGWGLIQFYSDDKIYSQDGDPEEHRSYLVALTGHQLAGQWFGGLVSPRWWSDIWLSKGFATYLHHLGRALVLPDEESAKNRVLELMQMVMSIDSKPRTHPVHFNVKDPQSEPRMFDSITYHKASSLIQMMNSFLTPGTFIQGLRTYLETHQFDSADQNDLWEQLTQAGLEDGTLPTHLNISTIMNTWTTQPGYPVVKVVRDAAGTSANVTQERFIVLRGSKKRDRQSNKWWIPLTYTSQAAPNFDNTFVKTWMPDTETQIQVDKLPNKDEWVIFNVQYAGFYRVNYDDNNWRLLTQQLLDNHTAIHVINRAQMIDDALQLALAGDLNFKTALNVTSYLSHENESLPWETFKRNVGHIEGLLYNTPALGALRKYVLSLLVPLYTTFDLGTLKDIRKTQRRHAAVVALACSMGHDNCVHLATTLYAQWMNNQGNASSVPYTLREVVFCTAIAQGGEAEFDFAMDLYTNTKEKRFQKMLLRAMGCKKEPETETGVATDEATGETGVAGEATGETGETTAETEATATESISDGLTGEATDGTVSETTLGTTEGSIRAATETTTEGTTEATKIEQNGLFRGDATVVEVDESAVDQDKEEEKVHGSWTTITSRWRDLLPILGGDEADVEELVLSATESFNTEHNIGQLMNFRDENRNDPGVVRASESALRRAEENLALREQYVGAISEFLRDKGFL